MPAVSGGGVPVDAFYVSQVGGQVVESDPTAQGVPVPASWAAQTSHKPVWTKCSATTSKGERCRMARVTDTSLCTSHWQTVGGVVVKGLRHVAGTDAPWQGGD